MTASGGPGVFKITGIADFRDILSRFREIESQAAKTGTQVGTALGTGIGKSAPGIKAAGDAAGEVEKRFNAAGRELLKAANGLEYWIDQSGKARAENGRFVTSAEKAAAGITEVGREAKKAGDDTNVATKAFGGLKNALLSLTAGVSITAFFKGAVDEAVAFESITRKLSNTLGEQGAGKALAFTKGLSEDLGLSFNTLAGTFGSFTAAATSANVPIETQQELFAAVSKSAQSLGLSNDELGGSLLALQQVASKGTVQMEELRGQLGERLPIAFGATARGLGVTQQELIKLVESGKLTADQFFPALTKGLNELTAQAGGTETATQNFQRLSNSWTELQASFGTTLLPTVVAGVQELNRALEGFQLQAEATKIGLGPQGIFGQIFGQVPELGAQAVGALRALGDQ